MGIFVTEANPLGKIFGCILPSTGQQISLVGQLACVHGDGNSNQKKKKIIFQELSETDQKYLFFCLWQLFRLKPSFNSYFLLDFCTLLFEFDISYKSNLVSASGLSITLLSFLDKVFLCYLCSGHLILAQPHPN